MATPRQAKVRVFSPETPSIHLSGVCVGTYFQFKDEDSNTKKRWDPRWAYQYLGRDGGAKSKYASVMHVALGRKIRVPLTLQVIELELVAIELRPKDSR